MYPVGNSRRTIRLDLMRSMRSPVLEMGVASTAELDELDAAALGAFRRDLARSLNNLHTGWPTRAGGTRRWPRPKKPVIIRQELAARWPDAHRDKLERSLRLEHGEDASDASPREPKA